MSSLVISRMLPDEWSLVGGLIYQSTNNWYQSHLGHEIFSCTPAETELFCRVYEDLDPGCCLVAHLDGKIVGSCFYHPRASHVSLGILNVDPSSFGKGIAKALVSEVCKLADRENKPVKLISSALNLDSFSIYSRAGFYPTAVYQDVVVPYPKNGHTMSTDFLNVVRVANIGDLEKIASFETKHTGLARQKDYKYFLDNSEGIWHTVVSITESCELTGFMVSHSHPASTIIGPGFALTERDAEALICHQLNFHKDKSPLVVVPVTATNLVKTLYSKGARNVEIHIAQLRGVFKEVEGYLFPTYLPETG